MTELEEKKKEIEDILKRAVTFSDFNKLPGRRVDWEESCAPTFRTIIITETSISTHMKVDGIDLTDESIVW